MLHKFKKRSTESIDKFYNWIFSSNEIYFNLFSITFLASYNDVIFFAVYVSSDRYMC